MRRPAPHRAGAPGAALMRLPARPGLSLWLVSTVLVLGLGLLMGRMLAPPARPDTAPARDTRRVDFELHDQHGRVVRDEDLLGQVSLVFFGYTYCPDICPATLFEMAQARRALGAEAERFRGVFISIDPERDTAERLRHYLGHFDPALLGLRGNAEQTAAAAASFGAVYRRGEALPGAGYLMDHSAFGHLLDQQARLHTILPGDAGSAEMARAVRAVLDGEAQPGGVSDRPDGVRGEPVGAADVSLR